MGAVHAKVKLISSCQLGCDGSFGHDLPSLDTLPMHGRDLGVNPDDLVEAPEPEQEGKQEILENKDVVVQHVNIQGLGRTKEDLLGYEISDVFHAKNLIDVMKKAHVARQKLLRLGIFNEVEVLIDTTEGADALPNGLDVTFEVTEIKRLTGSYNTMVGNNEGSMVLGLKLPNMLGRAEKLTFQFSYGTKETSYGLSFFKPQPGHFERNLTLNMYKVTGQFPWSSLKETDRGMSAELNFPLGMTSHTLKWEGVWRELGCLARSASFAVREESGHSLKSALSVQPGELFQLLVAPECVFVLSSQNSLIFFIFSFRLNDFQEMPFYRVILFLFSAHCVSRFKEFCHFPQQRGLTQDKPGAGRLHGRRCKLLERGF
ncbi:putative sorting and assembly machinery component 50 -like B-like [Scophthalmus maximus]|uniref:Putative sorting and assembly machinery component 50-like B-like n=1 Tax=Scophthalmus maximus TaxID=52904 RepID=A0A2U9B1X6_SCOMX|nr:putative sorting and assembly machinery component 50 -like B-like [Scophthalmus maximus]